MPRLLRRPQRRCKKTSVDLMSHDYSFAVFKPLFSSVTSVVKKSNNHRGTQRKSFFLHEFLWRQSARGKAGSTYSSFEPVHAVHPHANRCLAIVEWRDSEWPGKFFSPIDVMLHR